MTLSEFMDTNGLTDEALSKRLGVSRPYVTKLKNGTRRPSLDVAVRLEEITGIPARAFAEARA